jgi:hypothetical protein
MPPANYDGDQAGEGGAETANGKVVARESGRGRSRVFRRLGYGTPSARGRSRNEDGGRYAECGNGGHR